MECRLEREKEQGPKSKERRNILIVSPAVEQEVGTREDLRLAGLAGLADG
jgi:hypothetical protein